MRSVYLKQPYAEATLNVAPWYLRVYAGESMGKQLTKDQVVVRDVVEQVSGMTTRASMFDCLKSQRFYPMRGLQISDSLLHRFVQVELNPEQLCRVGWDEFANYASSLPLKFVRVLSQGLVQLRRGEQKLVDHTLAAMSVFPLKTVFKSYAMMGLYFYQEFDPCLCTAFESTDPVPMSVALSGLAKGYAKRPHYELLAAAMMIAAAEGRLDAARRMREDEVMMKKDEVMYALRSFGLATLFSLSVRDNAHCFSPEIVDTLQRYAGYMQGAIKGWQDKV